MRILAPASAPHRGFGGVAQRNRDLLAFPSTGDGFGLSPFRARMERAFSDVLGRAARR
jgi:hypothetical protein